MDQLTLNNRAGEPTEQVPNNVTGLEEMLTEDEHAEENKSDKGGEGSPRVDVELAVRRLFVAHE